MSRQAIRAAFKTAVSTVYAGSIFETRLTDSRDLPEYISIYLTSGDVETFVSFTETRAEIIIEFFKQAATDDVLDQIADQIQAAVLASSEIEQETKQRLYAGFEYETQDNGQNSLKIKFNINY